MRFYWLVLGMLGVWRLAHLFSREDGPWDLLVRLRKIAGAGFWGKLLDCFYCLSLWLAIPFALWIGETPKEKFLLWLAFSAGASLLEKATSKNTEIPPAIYYETGEGEDGLLRKE
jgi:hypothetical protein